MTGERFLTRRELLRGAGGAAVALGAWAILGVKPEKRGRATVKETVNPQESVSQYHGVELAWGVSFSDAARQRFIDMIERKALTAATLGVVEIAIPERDELNLFLFDTNGGGVVSKELWLYPQKDAGNEVAKLALTSKDGVIQPEQVRVFYVDSGTFGPLSGKCRIAYGELPALIDPDSRFKNMMGFAVEVQSEGNEKSDFFLSPAEPSPLLAPLHWGNLIREEYLSANGLPSASKIPDELWSDYDGRVLSCVRNLSQMVVYPVQIDEQGVFTPRGDQEKPVERGEMAGSSGIYRLTDKKMQEVYSVSCGLQMAGRFCESFG